MSGITLRDSKGNLPLEMNLPDGATWISSESGRTDRITRMIVSLHAYGGSVSINYVTVISERGGSANVWLPYSELSRDVRAYVTELDGALRALPVQI